MSFVYPPTRVVKKGSRWEISCPDHIYTNVHCDKVEANIITSTISDHFSTFATFKDMKNKHIPRSDVFVRKKNLSPTEWNNFYVELQPLLNGVNFDNDEHVIINDIVGIYQNLEDKYMPSRKLSRREKSFYYKPWLTSGIQKSMKTRDYLQKQSIKLKTEDSVKQYKKFKNFVNRLQNLSYNNFFSNKIRNNYKNKKKLWETVGEISKYK